MEDQILSTSYSEDDLLDQPFLVPSSSVINYDIPRDDYHSHDFSAYPDPDEGFPSPHPHQAQYWENCTATLEEVHSAVFTPSSTSPTSTQPPIVEVHRLDTRAEVITINIGDHEVSSSDNNIKRKQTKKSKKKSAYKHIPHSEKPAHLVEKRNARERRRVEAVNAAFLNLRKAVPLDNKRGKRVSKVKILQRAIDYILNMKDAIDQHDGVPSQLIYDDKDDDHLFAF